MELDINSLSNPKIKETVKYLKDGQRRQAAGIIIVDGQREILEAIRNKWMMVEFFYSPAWIKEKGLDDLSVIKKLAEKTYQLSEAAFAKISYKKTPDGFLAIFKTRSVKLEEIKFKPKPFVLILEAVEKPGNLGGIIRTAYAAGVDLIILNDQKTDIFSPNVIRSSTGFIFSLPLAVASVDETYDWLKKNEIQIFSASISARLDHFSADFKQASAVVFGTEAYGLSSGWLKKETIPIRIPMVQNVDSLNVSVSVGIIVYEAIRQREKLKN